MCANPQSNWLNTIAVRASYILRPGLRATYHYASKWSGSAVSYPTPPTDSRSGIGVHSRSSFVHVVRQQPPLCSEEVRSRGLCRRHQAAIPDLNSVPQLTQKISLPHVVLLGKNIKPSPVLEPPECIIYVASIELNIFWTTKLLPLLSMLLFSAGFSIVLPYGVIPPAHSELRLQNSLGIKKFAYVSAARQSLGWRGVRQKLLLNTITMVYKCRTKQVPPYLCDLFHDRFSVSGRNTRDMSQLNLPKCRLSTGKRSFAFRGAKEYNLPENIRNINDISSFIKGKSPTLF